MFILASIEIVGGLTCSILGNNRLNSNTLFNLKAAVCVIGRPIVYVGQPTYHSLQHSLGLQ